MKFASLSFGLAAILAALPLAAVGSEPQSSLRQQDESEVRDCATSADGQTLACIVGPSQKSDAAVAWLDERIAALRAEPNPDEADRTLLRELESRRDGTTTIITPAPIPK